MKAERILDRAVTGVIAVDLGKRDDFAHVAAGVEAPGVSGGLNPQRIGDDTRI